MNLAFAVFTETVGSGKVAAWRAELLLANRSPLSPALRPAAEVQPSYPVAPANTAAALLFFGSENVGEVLLAAHAGMQ